LGHMTLHETLINIIASSVLNLTPSPFSPIKVTGELQAKFGYKIKLPIFNEVIGELLTEKGASPPDLILTNDKLKMVVAVECKSDFNQLMVEKLSRQINFYSSEAFSEFSKSFLPEVEKSEIWIVTYSDQENLSERISKFVEKKKNEIKNNCNIVVWGVEIKKTDVAVLRKVCGEHQDAKLDIHLEKKGLETSLPQLELLIDSSLTYAQRVARIGRRIFSFIVSKSLTDEERTVSIADFKDKYGDAIMTDKELANCFRYLTRFIPEIGEYVTAKRSIILKAKPALDRIKGKIEALENVPDEDFKVELSRIDEATKVGRIRSAKKPKPFKGSLEPWIKKGNFVRDFVSSEIGFENFEPIFHEFF
jgi:hypothetical protein